MIVKGPLLNAVLAIPILMGVAGSTALILRASERAGRLVAEADRLRWESPPVEGPTTGLKAKVRFLLRNKGDRSVTISKVESGCGCTVVDTRQRSVGRGQTVAIQATGTPLASGERTVPITVYTDSPVTPVVALFLTMKTSRTPPFLLSVDGNLDLDDAEPERGTSTLTVLTIEKPGDSRPPLVSPSLDGLDVEFEGSTSTPFDESGTLQARYTYKVSFRESPCGTVSGSIVVTDPWTRNETRNVLVTYQIHRGFTVVPNVARISTESREPKGFSFFVVPGPAADVASLSIEPLTGHTGCHQISRKPFGPGRDRLVCELMPSAEWLSRPHECGVVVRNESGLERTLPIRPEGRP
ncbi:MAG: DUF1573 domain-containing protein [Isosphaeraceae bacterium]